MKRPITSNEIESVVQRKFTKSKSPGPDGFTGDSGVKSPPAKAGEAEDFGFYP